MGILVALVAAGSLAAGCGGSDSSTKQAASTAAPARAPTTVAPTVPAGFAGFTDTADRFTIAVPSAWRKVDPSSPGAAQAEKDLLKSNPSLAPLLSGDLVAQGIKFLAVDSAGGAVNVVVKPALGATDSDLPSVADAIKTEYQKGGILLRSSDPVQLTGHAALRLTADLPVANPSGGGKVTVHEVQYFIFANDLGYILTMAGNSPQFATIPTTFRVT